MLTLVLGETLFVFLSGGLAGLGLAKLAEGLAPAELGLALTPAVLGKALLVLFALALLSGLPPALLALRTSTANALRSR